MGRASRLLFLAILISGCGSPQPERVYVDLDRVLASDPVIHTKPIELPKPPSASPAVIVKQPGLPATSTTDRTIERLQTAKKLIAENRSKSIASFSSMLKRIYVAQANDEIAKRDRDVQPERDGILDAALKRLRQAFDAYGAERGPLVAQLNVLVRNTNLADQSIPDNADPITKSHIVKANQIRVQLREIEARYNKQAANLLDAAEKEIQSEIAALAEQAKKIRSTAEAKAMKEAEGKATQTQVSLDVQVTQLVPESLPGVPAKQVAVPGSPPLPAPPANPSGTIFGSLEERRHLLDQEVQIWIRSTGRIRSLTPQGGRDATEEFTQWRRAHKVGP